MSRRAVVTGAAGGIGAAICRRLEADGLEVVATDLKGADRVLDITDPAAAAALAEELGPVDVLVNNAGWDRVMPFLDMDAETRERVIRVNLLGPIGVTHAFARGMAERKQGQIVNIASDAGRVGSSGEVVYSAAKGGVIAFTKALARELARYSVNVNCVCPGPTETPMLDIFEGERGKQIIESMVKAVPFRRLAQPDEIAAAVAFLASDDAGYITGQTLSVSGGLTMA